MRDSKLKIVVLTSSRADYSIYLPLLRKISEDDAFDLNIMAFGTHVSKNHGYTIDRIKEDNFKIVYEAENYGEGDSPEAIAKTIGVTISKFATIWAREKFDLIFALGDRYEMFAAVVSTVPFNLLVAHIHGGETTLGAIDDYFRHSITHMSRYHFAVAEAYKERIIQLTGSKQNVYNVGSLSYDNLKHLNLFSIKEFKERFGIDLAKPSILITFHPETVSYEKNEDYVTQLVDSLKQIKEYQFIITMPNADTMGNMIREKLTNFIFKCDHAIGIESFGTIGYLTCMKYCSFLLGNTSSGFAEAAFFPKYVINLGNRQQGRIVTPNIQNCAIESNEIINAVNAFKTKEMPASIETYGMGDAAEKIIEIIKDKFRKR